MRSCIRDFVFHAQSSRTAHETDKGWQFLQQRVLSRTLENLLMQISRFDRFSMYVAKMSGRYNEPLKIRTDIRQCESHHQDRTNVRVCET